MKSYILLFFVILIAFCACKKVVVNCKEQGEDAFSPVLKKEILRMIEGKRQNNIQSKVCNVAILHDISRDSICSVIISLDNSILTKTNKFTPPTDSSNIQRRFDTEIQGYTFIGNELIFCYLFLDSCNNNSFVNKNVLIPYNDSIPGYPDISKDCSDRTSESPMCMYKIVGDSLQLIKSEWISLKSIR